MVSNILRPQAVVRIRDGRHRVTDARSISSQRMSSDDEFVLQKVDSPRARAQKCVYSARIDVSVPCSGSRWSTDTRGKGVKDIQFSE